MAKVVEYAVVLERMRVQGLRCLYHNSGAFGLPAGVPAHAAGWVGPEDPTIRSAALPLVRRVPPPYEANLARLARRAWGAVLPGELWLMPRSHWAYELEFGNAEWLADALGRVGIDAGLLRSLNSAAAIALEPGEEDAFEALAGAMFARLSGSDFALAFPGRPALCTLHHHKQLWWVTSDAAVMEALGRVVAGDNG